MNKSTTTLQPKQIDFDFEAEMAHIAQRDVEPPHVFKRLLLSEITKSYKTKKKLVAGIGTNDAHYRVSYKEDGRTYNCPYYDKWKYLLTRFFTTTGEANNQLYKGYALNKALLNFSVFLKWYAAIEEQEGIKPEPFETIDASQAQLILEQSKAVESDEVTLADVYGTSHTKDILEALDKGLTPEQEAEIDQLEADYGHRYTPEQYLELKANEKLLQSI
jgi:hypothetical protein